MLLRVLTFILVVVLFRSAVKLVRGFLAGARSRPEWKRTERVADDRFDRGRQVIDVEYTEERKARGEGKRRMVSETAPSGPASVTVENLTKAYRAPSGEPFLAVNGISFRAGAGSIFGLLGPNGAGKTTALRMLSTLIAPTGGRATVGGHDVVAEPAAVRRKIGFLTGSTGLYPRLTAREVVRYFARMYGLERDAAERRMDVLFEELDIASFQKKRCGDLSTGMKQKVSIARAIIHDPPILILDEPTTGLDVLASQHIVEFILRSRESGKCVIFSTHIMSEAERLCDEIAIIHHGRIVDSGTVEDLRRKTGKTKVEEIFLAILARGTTEPMGSVS